MCPVDAIAYPINRPRAGQPLEVDLSRRSVLIAGASGAALALSAGTSLAHGARDDLILRPPGALPEPLYLAACIRCGECVKSCVTNTLQPDGFTRGLSGLWVPRHQMRQAGCEQHCNVCGQVCPTGAIRPLDLEEKRCAKIGTSVILKEKCIAWEQDRLCLVCDECCPYNAIIFKTVDGRPRPVVIEDRCNGCGWCEHKCPVEGGVGDCCETAGPNPPGDQGSYQEEARRFGPLLQRGRSPRPIFARANPHRANPACRRESCLPNLEAGVKVRRNESGPLRPAHLSPAGPMLFS